MDKKIINFNQPALEDFIKDNAVSVPILLGPYTERAINAEKVLVKAHELSGSTQAEFQAYINDLSKGKHQSEYERNEFVDKCITSIEYPGTFKIHGYEALGNKPYIKFKKLFGFV